MNRTGWTIAAISGALILALAFGWWLQPGVPKLLEENGSEGISLQYLSGGASCTQSALSRLTARSLKKKTEACEEVREQRREAIAGLTESKRSSSAAEAQAIAAFKQTETAGWGISLGVVTVLAAIAAAFFAQRAAFHTQRGADIAKLAQRPWLSLSVDNIIKFQLYPEGKGYHAAPMLVATVHNFGGSPAISPWVAAKCVWGAHDPSHIFEDLRSMLAKRRQDFSEPIYPNEKSLVCDRMWHDQFYESNAAGKDDFVHELSSCIFYVALAYWFSGEADSFITMRGFFLSFHEQIDNVYHFKADPSVGGFFIS